MDISVDPDFLAWEQSIRREDWLPWFLVQKKLAGEAKYLGGHIMSEAAWMATVAEARRIIARLVNTGGIHDAGFVYGAAQNIATSHANGEGTGFFPCRAVEQVLLREHCPASIEIAATDFSNLLVEMASFAEEAGLLGAVFVEQKLNPLRAVHCTNEVAAVTLRLRFG